MTAPKHILRDIFNEAVEIAREYGGENSPRFVNGVLAAIRAAAERGADEKPSEGETTE